MSERVTEVAAPPAAPGTPLLERGPEATSSVRARRGVLRRMLRDRFAVLGAGILLLVVLLAIFAPWIARHDPNELFAGGRFEGPSRTHWLGTDALGRDEASRIVYGARVAVRVAVQVVTLTLLLAVPIGLLAGFRGGKLDMVAMRVMDAVHSVPTLVLALTLSSAFDLSFNWAMIGVSIALTPTMARLVRAETLAVREETYVEASTSIGTPTLRILRTRVLPNVASPIVVQTSIYVGGAILLEAGLSVLGIGISGGDAAWGSMLSEAFKSIYTEPDHLFYPGAAIALTVLAANLVGDGLRDALGLDAGKRYGARTRMGLTLATRREMVEADARDEVSTPLLEIRDLTVAVRTDDGLFPVVESIDLSLQRGEVLGLVGESGSGKTVTSMAIMRLLHSPPFVIQRGQVLLEGRDLLTMTIHDMRRIRGGDLAMVFQDPMAALNPSMTIGRQIAEAVRLHEGVGRRVAERRAVEMLDRVGIPDAKGRVDNFPHEFSGGMRQRAMIAMALSCSPKILIADEPTTALDVTIQAQIIELLRQLKEDFGLSIIFVTHDLGVVADFCDRVAVMYAGQIVEQAEVHHLFAHTTHPYTRALLSAMPRVVEPHRKLRAIPGRVPPVTQMPAGCRFHERCSHAVVACTTERVELRPVEGALTRCIRAEELVVGWEAQR